MLPQFVLAGENVVVGKTGPSQFHLGTFQFAFGLPMQQTRRQIPGCRHGERPRDLISSPAMLFIAQLPLEVVTDRVAEIGRRLEIAQRVEELRSQFRQFELLDLLDHESGRHLLPAQRLIRSVFRQQSLTDPSIARLRPRHQFVEFLNLTVPEAEHRPNPDQLFRSAGKSLSLMGERQTGADVIPRLDGPLERNQLAVMREEITESRFHIVVAESANRTIDGQTVPLGDIELGANFQIELIGHRSLVGQPRWHPFSNRAR